MGRVLVHKRLGRIASQKFRDDEKSDILFAVESFLKHVTAITIHCELNDATAS